MKTTRGLRMDAKIINAAKIQARKQPLFEPSRILLEISGVLQKISKRNEARKEYHNYLEEKYL